ncbi:MAG: O-antigen ligase family protein [Clostridiaceae bacterium]|nr:O-antigen ligase family protein [Clostridiaceae bacterium]
MDKVKNTLSNFKNTLFGQVKINYSSKGFDIADFAMILFFAQRFITYLMVSSLGKIGPVFIMGILGLMYVVAVVYKYKQNKRLDFLIFFALFFLVITLSFLSILRIPDLKFWIFGSQMNLPVQLIDVRKTIFALLIVILVKDFNKILRNIYYASLLNFVYLLYQAVLYLLSGNWDAYYSLPARNMIYNMSYGYEMIFVCIVLIIMAFIKKSLILLTMGSLALACSTFFGSRGSLLIFMTFALLMILVYAGDSPKINRTTIKEKLRYLLNVILVITISFLLMLLIPKLDRALDNLKEKWAPAESELALMEGSDDLAESEDTLSSRTVDSVIGGEFLDSNGRIKIWQTAFNSYLESPIFGKGIYGDRLEVGKRWYWGYSHNIVLELMNHFGIFGLAFFGYLLYSVIKKIIRSPEKTTRLLYIIVLSLCAKLFLSDSYLISAYFWLLIGLLIVDSELPNKLSNKKLALATLGILILSIVSGSILLIKDYQNQKFQTIKITKPTVILSTTNTNSDTFKIYQTIKDSGFQAVTFTNSSGIGDVDENTLTINDFTKMKESGAIFEDGEFFYQNTYIRPSTIQDDNRIRTKEFFMEHGLTEPIAYAPPYGSYNSTIEYRTMHHYSFVQVNKTGAKSQPIKMITYPSSMNMQARQLYWENADEKTELLDYIEKAKNNDSLIILNVNTNNFSLDQIKEILALLKDKKFESVTYQDLAEQAKLLPADFSLKNYIENTYMYGYINKYLN